MADSKKTAKKAEEVKTVAQLREEVATKQQDLLEAKRSNRSGELVNPRAITATRKEIARLLTAIRAAELTEKESN